MPQEATKHTTKSVKQLTKGKVRPKDMVWVLFENSKHHGKPYHVEEVHTVLADKLVEQGKVKIVPNGDLTDEQKEANKLAAGLTKESKKGKEVKKGKEKEKEIKEEKEFDL